MFAKTYDGSYIVLNAMYGSLRRLVAQIQAKAELSCIDERLMKDAGLTHESYFSATRRVPTDKPSGDGSLRLGPSTPIVGRVGFVEGISYGWSEQQFAGVEGPGAGEPVLRLRMGSHH
jgi:hypothetical protein